MDMKERITAWMEGERLTFHAAGLRVGCQPSTVHAWVNGTEPRGLYREKLERILRKWERERAHAD